MKFRLKVTTDGNGVETFRLEKRICNIFWIDQEGWLEGYTEYSFSTKEDALLALEKHKNRLREKQVRAERWTELS